MMENNQKEMGGCAEQKKGCCGCGHKHLVKWILKIVVLVLVFCFAFQMGVLKGKVDSMYGGTRMMHRGGTMMNQGGGSWGGMQPSSGTGSGSTNATPAQ